ncbi:glycosyltransferase [Actinoplanes sp. G11-F43]|uniref:glycosyltransferase n=1 Tax=Actinoplanes sp. G11-F43 TaxID=3424130 RepID=UPI003D34BEFE
MNILAVVHSPPGSGGHTTMSRVTGHLRAAGHHVTLVPDPDPATLRDLAGRHDAHLVIGAHAYLAGMAFAGLPVPSVIAFGGTDLNEFAHDPEAMAVMTGAVHRAAGLVAFSRDFLDQGRRLWPAAAGRMRLIPQAVAGEPDLSYSLRAGLGIGDDGVLLLLPAGLRPVKDPLLLIDTVQRWHREDPRVHLVIAGMEYDDTFAGIVRRRCARAPGVTFAGLLSRPRLHAAMLEATAVLNTSRSECMPNAVLEAMWLGAAVIVRDVPGNTCVIRHDDTGLLFGTPDEFRAQATRLLTEPGLRTRLGVRARGHAWEFHDPRDERDAYDRLVRTLTGPPPVEAARHGR